MTTLDQIKSVVDRIYPEFVELNSFVDSLDVVEIIMAVEDELDVDFDDYKLRETFTENTPLEDIPKALFDALI